MRQDVEALQREIETIKTQREDAKDRIQLYSVRGRGRGRGRGTFGRGFRDGQSDRYQRDDHTGFNRRDSQQDRDESRSQRASDYNRRGTNDRAERDDGDSKRPGEGLSASLRARLGSRAGTDSRTGEPEFRPNRDGHDHRLGKPSLKRRLDNSYNRDEEAAPSDEPLPGSNTNRLASAVVTDASQPVEEFTRRPTENGASKPEDKKRNKRLFGALLGTLQQFQEEDQRFKRTRLAQTRAEAELRAAEKAAENERHLKEKHRQDLAKARVTEINKKRELDLQLQAKQYEVLMVTRISQDMKLGAWLKTASGPPVLWLPKRHNTSTMLLLEQRQIELDAWQEEEQQRVEKHKQSILERFRPVPQPLPRASRLDTEMTEEKPADAEEGEHPKEEGEDRFGAEDASPDEPQELADMKEEGEQSDGDAVMAD